MRGHGSFGSERRGVVKPTGRGRGQPPMPDGRAATDDGTIFRVTFWSADWTPWRALVRIAARWPSLQVEVRPTYELA